MANRINVKLILELKSGGMSQNEIARSRHNYYILIPEFAIGLDCSRFIFCFFNVHALEIKDVFEYSNG